VYSAATLPSAKRCSAQLSFQGLALRQAIEQIERSLSNVSAFAQQRGMQARANAYAQASAAASGHAAVAHRLQTAAPSVRASHP